MKKTLSAIFFALLFAAISFSQIPYQPWIVPDQAFQPGDTVKAKFTVLQFDTISTYQFAVKFNPAMLHFSSVSLPNDTPLPMADMNDSMFVDLGDTLLFPDCIQGNFGLCKSHLGEIRTVWWCAPDTCYTVEDGTAIFTVNFIAKANGSLSQSLQLAPEIIAAVAYNFYLEPRLITLSFIDEITGSTVPPENDFDLQISPNPFASVTTVSFSLPQACEAQINVLDIEGRTIIRKSDRFTAGSHQIPITMPGEGIYIVQLVTPRGGVAKMVISK